MNTSVKKFLYLILHKLKINLYNRNVFTNQTRLIRIRTSNCFSLTCRILIGSLM